MLGIIGNKFSIGKETYQPYAAELHYFRIDKRYWSICFERIRRAGFHIIATAVPWNIHQESSGNFDFGGFTQSRRDLVVFLELAREFGFKVILRPGPIMYGQMPNAGLPKSLFNDIKLFARDSEGNEVTLPDSNGIPGTFLPSYLHSNFQFHLRNYFKAFIETTKNYVHPRGPIYMVELDYETSFGRLLSPASADYNPDMLELLYPEFLESLYEDIKKLNSVYKEQNASFEKVQPPRKFSNLELKHFPKALDWFRFKQFLLNEYLTVLEDIFTSYTVEPLFFRSLYFQPGDLIPAFNIVPDDRSPFLSANIFPEGSYFDLNNKIRYLKAEYGFAFASSFTSGAGAADPIREEEIAPISNNVRRFYYTAGLAAGLKGMNHYMFVDRDNWYGAPLKQDGTVTEGFELVRNFNMAIASIGFEEMDSNPEVAILISRHNYWLREIFAKKEFKYIPRLMNQTTNGFCQDLLRLCVEYGIRENRDHESMKQYKLVFIPSTEIMSEEDQEALVELAKAGTNIIMCGLMPKYDEHMKDCQVLAKHFRIKTSTDYHITEVEHKNGSFPSHVYASIRTTDDSKVRKLAKANSKLVAVCSTRFKGSLYFFAFDIASGGNHHKLTYIESIISNLVKMSDLYCSDPSVHLSFHKGPKKSLLMITVPPPGQLSDGLEASRKEVIIRADLRPAGFTGAKLKLTNLLEGEETKPLRLSAQDLRIGVPFEVDYPDGLMFLVEKG